MRPGWQPTVDGDERMIAEPSGSAPGVGLQGSAGVLVGRARELAAITAGMATARRGASRVMHLISSVRTGIRCVYRPDR